MYSISYHKRAIKKMKKMLLQDRKKLVTKILELKKDPLSSSLDIKRYYNAKKSWRIRAGNLRAIYTFDTEKKIVFIEDADYRGNIY